MSFQNKAGFCILLICFALIGCSASDSSAPANDNAGGPIQATSVPCERNGRLDLGQPTEVSVVPGDANVFCPIVMSIYGEILVWIEDGSKTVEYRKQFPADPVSHIIYFNNKTKMIQGYVSVVETLAGPPQKIVDLTWQQSAVSAERLMTYFGATRPFGFATRFRDYRRFAQELSLEELKAIDPSFQPPPGYAFLERYPELNARFKKLMVP